MWSFRIVVLLCTVFFTSGITFEYRIRCPDTAEKWQENSESYICDGDTVYHCMQNREGRYVVFCASSIWIQPDYCPEFNSRASAIDVILCPGDPERCPETVYLSNAVYQFPSCYRPGSSFRITTPLLPVTAKPTTWNRTTSTNDSQTLRVHNENDRSTLGMAVPILVGICAPFAFIGLGLLMFYVLHRKKDTSKAAPQYELNIRSPIREEQTSLLKPGNERHNENRESFNFDEQTNSDIEHTLEGKHSEVLFCKPKDYNIVVDTIKSEGVALLIGKSGSGKTTMASFIAKTEFKEYTITYMKPKETTLPKVNTEKILILWDDCLGVWNTTNRIDDRIFEALIRLIQLVKDNSEKMKAVVCIDSSSVDENQLNKLKDDVFCLNLDKSYESQLKKELFRNFLNLKIPVVRVSADVGFPLLIHLIKIGFCAQEESSSSRLLEEPVAYIRDDIDSILVKQSENYVTLIYAISNSSTIDLKKINRKLLDKIHRECHRIVHRKTDDKHPSSDSEAEKNTTEGTCEKADHNRNINNDSTEGSREEVGSEGSSSENLKLNNRTSLVDKTQQVKGKEKGNVPKHMKIHITDNLLRYLVVSDETSEYKFRHRFLAECILRYHIEHVGRETVLMEGPEEVRTAVEHLSEIYQEQSNNT